MGRGQGPTTINRGHFPKIPKCFWACCRLFFTIHTHVLGLYPYSCTAFPVPQHTYYTHSKFNFFLGSWLVGPILHMYRGGLWPYCDSGSMAQVCKLDSSSAAGAVQGRTAWGHSKRAAGKASSSTGFCPKHLDHFQAATAKTSATGTRARVARMRAEYPNQLDYSGF